MKSKYTIGAMIGNAISTHILEVMQGICQAAKSMNANVLFFLGIHCGFYYKLNELEDIDKDFDYQSIPSMTIRTSLTLMRLLSNTDHSGCF